MWGNKEEWKCISKRKRFQEALFSCPQLCWGDFVCVLPLYQPIQAELWGPLDVRHKLDLLMVETLVLFCLGTFPWLLFQGVSPVCRLCSLTITHQSCALNVGSSYGFLMGLVLAGGFPLPLPPLPDCQSLLEGIVAHNYCPLLGTIQNEIVGFYFNLYSKVVGKWYCHQGRQFCRDWYLI